MLLVLFLSGCKTNKSVIDKKEIETEKVFIQDKSVVKKNFTSEETANISDKKEEADK